MDRPNVAAAVRTDARTRRRRGADRHPRRSIARGDAIVRASASGTSDRQAGRQGDPQHVAGAAKTRCSRPRASSPWRSSPCQTAGSPADRPTTSSHSRCRPRPPRRTSSAIGWTSSSLMLRAALLEANPSGIFAELMLPDNELRIWRLRQPVFNSCIARRVGEPLLVLRSGVQPRAVTRRCQTSGWIRVQRMSAAFVDVEPAPQAPSASAATYDLALVRVEVGVDQLPERVDFGIARRAVTDHPQQVCRRAASPQSSCVRSAAAAAPDRARCSTSRYQGCSRDRDVGLAAQERVPKGSHQPALRLEGQVHGLRAPRRPRQRSPPSSWPRIRSPRRAAARHRGSAAESPPPVRGAAVTHICAC